MELGLYTFGQMTPHPATGATISAPLGTAEVIGAAQLADEVWLDIYGVGEHHRPDFAGAAAPVILVAIATTTKRIRLTSTDDPDAFTGRQENDSQSWNFQE